MKRNLLMIIMFFLVIVGFPVISLILPDQGFSQNENRVLASIPEPDMASLKNESFMHSVEAYVSDHFAFRENWIVTKNNIDILMGKTEIGGVITKDNQMVEVWKDYDEVSINKNLSHINDFALENPSLNVSFILSPTIQGVSMEELPDNAGLIIQEDFILDCYTKLDNLNTINVFGTLKENNDKYIFYRTDHHWTSFGAYLAYREYCEYSGLTPYKEEEFNVEVAADDFKGTLYSKTLNKKVTSDEIAYYTLKDGEPKVKVKTLGEQEKLHDGLYYREYLNEKDKYSSFIGQNEAIVNIQSEVDSNNRSLLVIKDSYAHALVPFLSKHYKNITMVDLRYLNARSVNDIDLENYTDVLFIYNCITFSGEKAFFMLDKFTEN